MSGRKPRQFSETNMPFLCFTMRTLESKPQIVRNDFATSLEVDSFIQFTMMAIVVATPLGEGMPQLVVINSIKRMVDHLNIRGLMEQDLSVSRGVRLHAGASTDGIVVSAANSAWENLPVNSVAIQVGGESGAVKDGSTVQIFSMFKRLSEALLEQDFKIIK